MTINDLANVHYCNIDNATGKEISHREKYRRVISALGYENVKKCIPFSLDEIKEALPKDKHLNNLSMKKWDSAAGFICEYGKAIFIGSPLIYLYHKNGVNAFSPSDGVCILKEAARLWVEMTDKEMNI